MKVSPTIFRYGNDIAWLRLSWPLPRFDTQINSICLPTASPRFNSVVTAVGWGTTEAGSISSRLKEVTKLWYNDWPRPKLLI